MILKKWRINEKEMDWVDLKYHLKKLGYIWKLCQKLIKFEKNLKINTDGKSNSKRI